MKRLIALCLALALALPLMGCGSKATYLIRTKSCDAYLSDEEPRYDGKSDTYRFEDLNGSGIIINKDDVKTIQEYEK